MSQDHIDPAEFLVKSKIRVLLQEADMRASGDLWDALGHSMTRAVKRAVARAQANGRKTVKGCDV